MPKPLPALILSAASLAVCLLLLEGGLRLAGFNPMADLVSGRQAILMESADPILGYELTPNTSGFAWHTEVEINAHGIRDRTRPLEPGNAFRILALGDSVTFGSGMKEVQRFTNLLEPALSSRVGRSVEVLNFGVGGYDTLQEVAFLERKGLRFSPDLVLLAYCMNDVGDNSPNLEYIRSLSQLDSVWYHLRTVQLVRTFVDRLQLARWLTLANEEERFRERNRGLIVPLGDDPRLVELRDRLRDTMERTGEDDFRLRWHLSDAHLGRLEFALQRLDQLSDEHGFDVVVSILPVLVDHGGFEPAYAIVEHLARRRGFEVIQLHPVIDGYDPRELRLRERDDIHPNAKGHRLLADGLAEELANRLPAATALSH